MWQGPYAGESCDDVQRERPPGGVFPYAWLLWSHGSQAGAGGMERGGGTDGRAFAFLQASPWNFCCCPDLLQTFRHLPLTWA